MNDMSANFAQPAYSAAAAKLLARKPADEAEATSAQA